VTLNQINLIHIYSFRGIVQVDPPIDSKVTRRYCFPKRFENYTLDSLYFRSNTAGVVSLSGITPYKILKLNCLLVGAEGFED
jgi:hypothetical protein